MNARFSRLSDRKFRAQQAQGMTEYIIVVSLVAIACITAVTVFGQKIARLFHAATSSIDKGTPQNSQASDKDRQNLNATLANMEDASGGSGS